jgi:hypothetical protein
LNLSQKDLNLYDVDVKVNPLTKLTQLGLRDKAETSQR